MKTPPMRPLLAACFLAVLVAIGMPPVIAAEQPPTAEALLKDAELAGSGQIAVYTKKGSVILSVPRAAIGKPFIWYAEVVGLPAGVVSDSLEAGSLLARLERHGDLIVVRDLNTQATQTGGGDELPAEAEPGDAPIPGSPDPTPFPERPIDVALNMLQTSPAIAAFPVAAELPDGTVLIDVTSTFANDIASFTARDFVALSGLVPAAVDPGRSYIERVRATAQSFSIRSHLTFLAANPANAVTGVKPVSVVIGHSFIWLF